MASVNEIVPIGNDVVDRAALMAKRNTAIHATSGLRHHFVFGKRFDEFVPIGQPLRDLTIVAVMALDF